MSKAIGIDLGTSNSVVSVVVNGQPVVIPDEDGHHLQPSVVSFLNTGEIVVGPKARARKVLDPANTVYSVKRLIGRPFYSEEVRIAQSHYPYQVVCGRDNNPKIFVQNQEYSPEEISAMILRRMKTIAERYLGQRVERAVITVPANFNEAQRFATKAAGEIAGLEVLRILNEPTAAALAYGYDRSAQETIAIYDFGGGTFDVTTLSLRNGVFEVLSTAGDTYLGGDDFDNRLVDYMVAAFQHTHGYDLSTELIAVQRLKNIAERIKKELSFKDKVAVHIKEIIPGSVTPVVLSFSISRDGFNERCGDIIKRSFLVCDEALRLGRLSPAHIQHVVLVGGSTRIPLVRTMVSQYFGQEPVGDVNPDEVVAVGAAIYASSLDQQFYAAPPIPAGPPPIPGMVMPPPIPGGPPPIPGGPPPIPGGAPAPIMTPNMGNRVVPIPGMVMPPPPSGPPPGPPSGPPPVGGNRVVPIPGMVMPPPPAAYSNPQEATHAFQSPFAAAPPSARPPGSPPLLLDVTSQALGIATAGGFCDTLIARNQNIPAERRRTFSTSKDNQDTVRIQIMEGDSRKAEENSKLGELLLTNLPPTPRGTLSIEVVFEIDTNGILNVSACDTLTGQLQRARLDLAGTMQRDQIAAMAARQRNLQFADLPGAPSESDA